MRQPRGRQGTTGPGSRGRCTKVWPMWRGRLSAPPESMPNGGGRCRRPWRAWVRTTTPRQGAKSIRRSIAAWPWPGSKVATSVKRGGGHSCSRWQVEGRSLGSHAPRPWAHRVKEDIATTTKPDAQVHLNRTLLTCSDQYTAVARHLHMLVANATIGPHLFEYAIGVVIAAQVCSCIGKHTAAVMNLSRPTRRRSGRRRPTMTAISPPSTTPAPCRPSARSPADAEEHPGRHQLAHQLVFARLGNAAASIAEVVVQAWETRMYRACSSGWREQRSPSAHASCIWDWRDQRAGRRMKRCHMRHEVCVVRCLGQAHGGMPRNPSERESHPVSMHR